MASYNVEQDVVAPGYGGFGGFGGGGIMAVIAILLIGFILFGRHGFGHGDGHHGGHHAGHGFTGCAPATRPYFPDESNYQQSRELDAHMCRLDRDILMSNKELTVAINNDGNATRSLIEQNYIQDLRDRLTEKCGEIQTLKSEAFTSGLFGALNSKIDMLACELPKRLPSFAHSVVPCNTTTVTGCGDRDRDRDFPRRGHCGFDAI